MWSITNFSFHRGRAYRPQTGTAALAAIIFAGLALASCEKSAETAPAAAVGPASATAPAQAGTPNVPQTDLAALTDDDLKKADDFAHAKFEKAYKSQGISGVVGSIKSCYAKLRDQSPARDRARCIYLDTATFQFENSIDPTFRAVDIENMPELAKDSMDARIGPQLAILSQSDKRADKMAFAQRMGKF